MLIKNILIKNLLLVFVSLSVISDIKSAEYVNKIVYKNGMTGAVSVGSGALSYILLRVLEKNFLGWEKSGPLLFSFNALVSSLIPGLIAADYADNKKIDGSNIKNLLSMNQDNLYKLYKSLIDEAGITNVVASFIGVLLADYYKK